MSHKFTQILIKDTIKQIQKQKLNKTIKNHISKKEKRNNWTIAKEIRLDTKKSWIFK